MIFTIFKKELKDTLRDKRTIMMMLVIPVLVFPIIINVFVSVSKSFEEKQRNKAIAIGYVGDSQSRIVADLDAIPATFGKKTLIAFDHIDSLKKYIAMDSIQFGFSIPASLEESLTKKLPIAMEVFFDATEVGMQDRAEVYMEIIQNKLTRERLEELEIDEQQIHPLNVSYTNTASDKEVVGKLAGGVLPYIFIVFGFIGCMYPAIDLFTGEKERGTMETLLTTPVARWKILFGKMGVVVLSGLLASTCALLGLFLSVEVFNLVEDERLMEVIHSVLTGQFVGMLALLLIPLTIFFAGVMIPIAVYAKTFKEAQSIITPLNVLIVLPAMIGFFPGVELNAVTASIPVVNVVLATKEVIAGTLEFPLLLLSFTVMVALAVLAVGFSYKRFGNETNIISD